ncbi:MAG TPA: class I SAM-dependent rRNA methyltransferase [Candidatus Competibacteraceae bacterium]|nr:class I SAM-dependent rRNA methyltransferase [Candidatus Competibacteraceae bacterium]MCP5134211.1 class I SAM-dependent rRNA methyltransferase [Gammaproteobacteria bacterium]HPF58730.1 class I SAM-dependent rRNA methyltransferase [Candidatus Competibacteraceae bacterium]HRY18223.1 class I SAM-dependent rRNA methyltransferase [Candidatus Competibacteraceae bacterium]
MPTNPVSSTEFAPLRLRKNEDRRLRAGHLWIYSNEIDVDATPLRNFQPGQPVTIQASNGQFMGTGYINPHVLLCARLVSRDIEHPLSPSLLVHRLNVALSLRERVYERPFYRLVYGEGDGLPGLIVDRYGDLCVVQITTAGMERLKDDILAALQKVLKPGAVLWRNDSPMRELEGLERYVAEAAGKVPEFVTVEEDSLRFQIAPRTGQKTGWFYDQRDNRARLDRYIRDRRVLDMFSYVGAWGIRAAARGAREARVVDSSAPALALAAANAALNGISDQVQIQQGDAFEVLKALREARERFDVVIVDPPAFIKRRKDFKEGALAYRRINEMAMQVLERDGLLVSCSCSQLLSRDLLIQTLLQAARHLDRNLVILEQGRQGPDHPVPPAILETEYLKMVLARVLPA